MKNTWVVALCLLVTMSAGSSAIGLTISADDARIKTAGQPAGEAWNVSSNGDIGDYIAIAQAGTYKIVVRAHGTPFAGVYPLMALTVDGRATDGQSVGADATDYRFTAELSAGIHCLTATFFNDALNEREDRNLFVERINVSSPPGAPQPTLGDVKQWESDMAARDQAAVDQADDAIEKNRKADVVVRVLDAAGKPVSGAAVKVEQVSHEFLFGCNIYMFDRFTTSRENELYKDRFAALFNYATTGFYWQAYEPRRGQPDYGYTDKVVSWCSAHAIRLKGHPLLCDDPSSVPPWSLGQPPEAVRRQRVTDILQRYSGKIEFWEVVNEPTHFRGLSIDEPYRWARAADATAKLIVNDYEAMANGSPPFYKLLELANRDGVPFDGIGIQAHEPANMRFPLDRVRQILDRYAALGKPLHITEFTPTSSGEPITGSNLDCKWDEAAQADYAGKFYRVCFAHPAVVAITWWDLCDQGSWRAGGGMLRADLSPKPVYMTLQKLIREQWHTRAEGKTDENGRFRVRGFLGNYAVTVNDKPAAKTFPLFRAAKAQPAGQEWVVKLDAETKP